MHKRFQFHGVARYMAFGLAAAMLLLILACGGDEDTPVPQATSTPQPTATPLDVVAITSALQDTIRSTVDNALAGITPSEGLSASQINRIVEAAVTAAIPDTASAEEISALVETAVAASVTPGLSAGEITSLVSSAVAEATAGQAEPLTAAEVEAIVTSAIAGIPTATPQPTSTPAPTPTAFDVRRGGTLTMQMGVKVSHWGVHQCEESNSCMTSYGPIYNGLIEYNPETEDQADIRGDLATGWDLAADGVTYTFNINPDATWHDGMPVTAADVVFSLDNMTTDDPDKPRIQVGILKGFYESSSVINDKTVELKTQFPAPAFFPILASEYMKIIPKHRFEGMSEDDARLAENILGSGPFKLVDFDPDISVEYTRNAGYWKEGRPYLDEVKYFVITDPGTAFAAYKAGRLLTSNHTTNNLSCQENTRLGEELLGKGTMFWAGPVAILWITMNTERAPYTDPNVRHAFQLALHRQPFVDIFGCGQDLIGSPFPPGSWFGSSLDELLQKPGYRELNGEKHPDDIAEAKNLLAAAGIGEGFKVVNTVFLFAEFPDMAELAMDQYRTFLGLDASADVVDFGVSLSKRLEGDYDLHHLGYGQLSVDPHDFMAGGYIAGAGQNYPNWSHPRVEELFVLQSKELDRAKRREYALEVETILLEEDTPYIFVNWIKRGWYVDNRIRNFHVPAGISDVTKWEHIWCDPSCF
jgi:peptide/nickel transport system substrate-binding protein